MSLYSYFGIQASSNKALIYCILKEDFHGYAHAPTDSLQNKSFGSILNLNSGS